MYTVIRINTTATDQPDTALSIKDDIFIHSNSIQFPKPTPTPTPTNTTTDRSYNKSCYSHSIKIGIELHVDVIKGPKGWKAINAYS